MKTNVENEKCAIVVDLEGNPHMGIIQFPVPILKGNTEILNALRTKLFEPQFAELTVVDLSDLARGCKTYDEFTNKMANTSEVKLNYIGIAICGNKKHINKLTGNMPLLR